MIFKNSQFWAKPETSITLTTSPPVNDYTNTLGNNSHSNSVINNTKQIGFTCLTADRRPTLSKFCGCPPDTEHLKSITSEKEQKLHAMFKCVRLSEGTVYFLWDTLLENIIHL